MTTILVSDGRGITWWPLKLSIEKCRPAYFKCTRPRIRPIQGERPKVEQYAALLQKVRQRKTPHEPGEQRGGNNHCNTNWLNVCYYVSQLGNTTTNDPVIRLRKQTIISASKHSFYAQFEIHIERKVGKNRASRCKNKGVFVLRIVVMEMTKAILAPSVRLT